MVATLVNAIIKTNKQNEASAEDLGIGSAVQAIYVAIFAHENWKYRLQSFVEGTSKEALTAEQVYRADNSELGKWLDGIGKAKFAQCIAFSRLIDQHKMYHYTATNLVSLMQAGKTKEAKAMLNGQFEEFSDAIIASLLQLREVTESVVMVNKSTTRPASFLYAQAA